MEFAPSSRTRRGLEEPSADEIARLLLLNENLTAADAWIHERVRQCLSAYYAAGNVKSHRFAGHVMEDVKIEAKATCVLRADRPGFSEDGDCVVAELDARTLSAEVIDAQYTSAQFGPVAHRAPPHGFCLSRPPAESARK